LQDMLDEPKRTTRLNVLILTFRECSWGR
jgi:hypothetical protein